MRRKRINELFIFDTYVGPLQKELGEKSNEHLSISERRGSQHSPIPRCISSPHETPRSTA